MIDEMVTLDHAAALGESLSPAEQLRLIGLLAERLHGEMKQNTMPIDMLPLAGLDAELWRQIDFETYLEDSAK